MYPVWSNSRRVSHFFVRRKKCVSEIKAAIRFEPVGTWINSKGGEKHYRDWTRKKRENDFERSQGLTQLSMLKQVCWWVSEWVRGREGEGERTYVRRRLMMQQCILSCAGAGWSGSIQVKAESFLLGLKKLSSWRERKSTNDVRPKGRSPTTKVILIEVVYY